MPRIVIAYHSGFGHTKAVAESIARGVQSHAGTTADLIAVNELPDPGPQRKFEGDWAKFDAADGIIFGSPTYMGSISAEFKKFMERTSPIWFGQKWKDKLAGGFVNSGNPSGDKLNALMDLVVFAGQHQMLWVSQGVWPSVYTNDGKDLNRLGSWLGVMTWSMNNEPADKTPPPGDHATAEAFGLRFAKSVEQWVKGRK